MTSQRSKLSLSIGALVAALAAIGAEAHMEMSSPTPRRHPNNPGPNGEIDYDYPTPLNTIANFPCKQYGAQASVASVAAGATLPVTLSGGAPHDGGHCQFALSYDGDKTWVVIDTIIRDCMRYATPQQVNLRIPSGAPAGKATLAWTWINAVGNREYYMNCADITVSNPNPTGFTGAELVLANLEGYPTIPEFPGDLPDGRDIFNHRRTVTVSATGAMRMTGAPAPSQLEEGEEKSVPEAAKPVDGAKDAAEPAQPDYRYGTPAPAAPAPANKKCKTPSAGAEATCTNGAMACAANGTIYRQCANGKWVDRPVPKGTVCSEEGGKMHLAHAPKY